MSAILYFYYRDDRSENTMEVGACAKLWIGVWDVKRVVILWIQKYPRHTETETERERERESRESVSLAPLLMNMIHMSFSLTTGIDPFLFNLFFFG